MADATTIETPTNPCALCAGDRIVQEIPWRDPTFWVTCVNDGRNAFGTTQEDAVAAWNLDNADRSLTAGDIQDVKVALLAPTLSAEFLATLATAVLVFAESGETDTVDTFAAWCVTLAS